MNIAPQSLSTIREDLYALRGQSVDASSISAYMRKADLIAFDGPLLSLYAQADGQEGLLMWLDHGREGSRWSLTPVNSDALRRYLAQEITLRDVLLPATKVFVFLSGEDALPKDCLELNRFPESYLPSESSYLADNISTPAAKLLALSVLQQTSTEASTAPVVSDPAAIAAFKRVAEILLRKGYGLGLEDTGFCEEAYVAACILGGARPFECLNEHAEECGLFRVDLPGTWGEPSKAPLLAEDEDAAIVMLAAALPVPHRRPSP